MRPHRPHEPLFVLREHTAGVLCCNFFDEHSASADSPLTNWLLTGDVSGVVKIWDLSLRRSVLTFHPFSEGAKVDELGPTPSMGSPFNPGIIAVGFLWFTGSTPSATRGATLNKSNTSSSLTSSLSPSAVSNMEAGDRRPTQRQRFRLTKPAHSLSTLASTTGPKESLLFYTQCRNQILYIWSVCVATNGRQDRAAVLVPQCDTLRLEYKLSVPQHGFCAAGVWISPHSLSALIAVPHDTNGQVTLWRVASTLRDKTAERPTSAASGSPPDALPYHTHAASNGDALMTMDPRDALIARSQAEERLREAKQRGEATDEAKAFTVVETSAVHVQHLTTFSASGSSFKGGVMMQLRLRDEAHLSVAFESGHIALCLFRQWPSPDGASGEPSRPVVLCATRTFAEPAATCLWTGDDADGKASTRVVATSASGHVQCYTLSASTAVPPVLSPELCWEQRFPKGLGSAVLQGHLLVIGAWDQTVRVLDVRTGTVLSILTQHSGTVQQVAAVPSRASALQASFGFDSRHPHLYAANARFLPAAPRAQQTIEHGGVHATECNVMTPAGEPRPRPQDENLVYLFGSCSDDGTVAVWRVDLHDVTSFTTSPTAPIRPPARIL